MERPAWEQSKRHRLKRYLRRRPEESVLYRVVYHYRDELERRWDGLFLESYGSLRREVLDALDHYLSCGILAHGCARARCEKCNHSQLIAFSCKRRCLCPSCDTKRSLLFAEHLDSNLLLPYPHRHAVWSIPKRLRVYFRYDRKLIKHLYSAAWNAWRETISEALPGDGASGAIMALHSSGDLLNFHPHVHSLCLDGILEHGSAFSQLSSSDVPVVTQALTARFADHIFTALLRAELITQDVVDNMRSWEHSGFNVFLAEPTPPDNHDARLFLARYLKRSPLSLERTTLIESALAPTIRITKKLDDGDIHRNLSPLEFLAELQQHIPDMWEQTTRYFGKYAARTRAAERRQVELKQKQMRLSTPPPTEQPSELPEPPHKASSSWAALIKRVYEVDPLVCDKCGGTMKIIAFLQQEKEINKLCENLGYPKYRAPPPLHATSAAAVRTVEPVWDDFEQSILN